MGIRSLVGPNASLLPELPGTSHAAFGTDLVKGRRPGLSVVLKEEPRLREVMAGEGVTVMKATWYHNCPRTHYADKVIRKLTEC